MSGWQTIDFDDLPEAANGLRWMASTLMDRATFETEGWERRFVGDHPYWRARSSGLRENGRRVRERREERRARWAASEAAKDEWSGEIERIVEAQA